MRRWTSLLCFVLLWGLATTTAIADDWPRFRGPAGDGVAPADDVFDGESPGLGVAWQAGLGSGYSGVSVASGKAVTMFAQDGSDWAVAFDAESGRELWRYEIGPTYKGHDGSHDGPISTPVLDGDRVYGLGPLGHLFALRLDNGEPLWATHLQEEHEAQKPYYGFSSSPLLQDGVLVLEVARGEDEDGTALAGFDPATGERLWTAGQDGVAYQSPMPITVDGRRYVLATGNEKLFGLDPKSGEILWEHPHGGDQSAMGNQTLNPVPAGDGRLLLMHQGDASKMVRLVPGEDGAVTLEDVWEDRSLRRSYNVPVYHDGHFYGYSGGFLTAVEAETGKSVWKSRQPGDGFLSLVDGHLVIVTKKGDLAVARATPDGYEEVASLPLFEGFAWTPPSFANGKIYARSHDAVAAVNVLENGMARAAAARDTVAPPAALAQLLEDLKTASNKTERVDRFVAEHGSPVVDGNRVAFLYRGEARDVGYMGDLIGDRAVEAMVRVPDTNLFYYLAEVEPNAAVSYQYVLDFDETVTDPLSDETVPVSEEDQASWLRMPEWKDPGYVSTLPEDAPRGRLESFELDSEIFDAKRQVQVWLPPDYDASDQRYPVAYVHGAKAILEFGEAEKMLDHLIGGERTSPGLVVFVHQVPPARGGEWFGPLKEGYAQSMAEELVPEIDERYRTRATRDARASVGFGFAGFGAAGAALRRPETFGRIAGQSVFMLTAQLTELTELAKAIDAEKQPEVHLAWGRYDYRSAAEGWDIREANRQLAEELREMGYTVETHQTHDGWGWPAWRTRTDDWVRAAWGE